MRSSGDTKAWCANGGHRPTYGEVGEVDGAVRVKDVSRLAEPFKTLPSTSKHEDTGHDKQCIPGKEEMVAAKRHDT